MTSKSALPLGKIFWPVIAAALGCPSHLSHCFVHFANWNTVAFVASGLAIVFFF
jgi:hypothetical protein